MSQVANFNLDSALEKFRRHIQYTVPEKEQVTEGTAQDYAREVELFEEYIYEHRDDTDGLLDADESDLRQYLGYCRKSGNKPRTVIGRRSAISRFYNVLAVLVTDGALTSLDPEDVPPNPNDELDQVWSVPEPEKSKQLGEEKSYLDPGDVQKLYRHAEGFRDTLILKTLYQTGMRRKELAHLRLDDVQPLANQEMTIRHEGAKGGKRRRVYYKESLIKELRRWIDGGERVGEGYSERSNYLFPTRESEHIHPNYVTRIVKKAAEKAGLQAHVYTDSGGKRREKVGAHTLRNSYAINMLRSPDSVDVRTLQKHLGHSDLETTEAYLDIVRDDAKQEYTTVGGPPEGE
jgi:integrase/recombinase XerD